MARGIQGEEGIDVTVSPEDMPRKITPRMQGQVAPQEFAQAFDAIGKKYQADSTTFASNTLASFRQKSLQDLNSLQDNTADPTNFTPTWQAQFDKGAKALTDSRAIQSNPIAYKMINEGVNELRDTMTTHVLGWQAAQTVNYRASSFDNNLKASAAQVEAHPEMLDQVGSTLTDQANAIGGDPSQRLKNMRVLHDTLQLAAANGLTRQDPRGALQALNNPDSATGPLKEVVSNLSDAQREAVRAKANEHLGDQVYTALQQKDFVGAQLALSKNMDILDPRSSEQLQRTINSQVELAHSMDEKAQRDSSNNLLKNAILMSQQGGLTPQWIEKYHNTWEPAAYEYAYKLLSGKEATTDTHVYAPLLTRALQGQDVTDDANRALNANQLSLSDYKGLLEKSETPRKGYVTFGSQYINDALKPNPMVSDPAGQRSLANALDDWRQWTSSNPAATNEQARTAYRSIADHYQIVSAEKSSVFMAVPIHLVGTRLQPDIQQTWLKTKAAHDSGQMSDAEFAQQATLIQQWTTALSKKGAPAK